MLGRSATAKKKILKFTRFWSNETFSVSKIISIDKTIPISISNLVSFDTASLYYVEFPELFIIASLQKKSVEACSRLASQEISCLFFWNPKCHDRAHKNRMIIPVLNLMKTVRTLTQIICLRSVLVLLFYVRPHLSFSFTNLTLKNQFVFPLRASFRRKYPTPLRCSVSLYQNKYWIVNLIIC